MRRHVVTLNAGSSSIKFALFAAEDDEASPLALGLAEMTGEERRIKVRDNSGATLYDDVWSQTDGEVFHEEALRRILSWQGEAFPSARIDAVGHRVVHGGVHYDAPVIITGEVIDRLEKLVPLAPLHEPHNIAGIKAAREAWPESIQVACFDTAFHRSYPFVNDVFALPRQYYAEGVRRYGFHGLSYEYVSTRLREVSPSHAKGRVVVAHLGNGASMCAIQNGRSVASSMGFTALDGLPMGTRCGQLDPGVVLYLMQEKKLGAEEISNLLYKESGLKGLSGISHDMRELEASGASEAREAIDYFVFRIRRELGGLAAVLQGIDAIVFCGGIGENAWRVRERVLEGMEWLGVELDRPANERQREVISSAKSPVRVFVIPTNEEQIIARHALQLADARADALA
ncbi:acetate/propionate family kinase [Methylocystis sp. L43]|uniref:acetate/propionate family kinase n=1 Tax=unclassified Methylocystis TaxID=2625913 RepID=UPI0018C265F5|nr:acetate/propionate family kinase [Methylocystis sp. L43]MBG0807663.1 acetate/propionate family kinase [Methylocystis sp. H15]